MQACPWGVRRAIVADISDRNVVVVAILAHVGLPAEAPARRSYWRERQRLGQGRARDDVAKAWVCHEDDVREFRGALG